MDFLDVLNVIDEAVDTHLGDTADFIKDGVLYEGIRGPFDRDVFTEEASSAYTTSLSSTFNVQSMFIPEDPRKGVLVCRGEFFDVIDFDSIKDGRTTLILKKISDNDFRRESADFPYPID